MLIKWYICRRGEGHKKAIYKIVSAESEKCQMEWSLVEALSKHYRVFEIAGLELREI